ARKPQRHRPCEIPENAFDGGVSGRNRRQHGQRAAREDTPRALEPDPTRTQTFMSSCAPGREIMAGGVVRAPSCVGEDLAKSSGSKRGCATLSGARLRCVCACAARMRLDASSRMDGPWQLMVSKP